MSNNPNRQDAFEIPNEPNDERASAYLQVTSFEDAQAAGAAYTRIQQAIFQSDAELSVYRLMLDGRSYIAILGDLPSSDLDSELTTSLSPGASLSLTELEARLRKLVSTGTPAQLPQDVLDVLIARREAATRNAFGWTEGHYRPGLHIRRENAHNDE